MRMIRFFIIAALFCGIAFTGILPAAAQTPEPSTAAEEEQAAVESEALILDCLSPWTGDLDGMIDRRMIRVLTVFSKTFYTVDRGTQRGITYEALKKFEDDLNARLKLGAIRVNVVFVPVSRDRLIPGLIEGLGDIVAANLTITDERRKLIDFSDPAYTGVREVIVTASDTPPLKSVDDLAGREVVVRRSSSYYESLFALNKRFAANRKVPMTLTLADEDLEDEDLLEMVNAGLYPAIVVDDHKARFWRDIFDKVTVHETIAVRTGGEIAWALRKNSPKLKAALDTFLNEHKIGTKFGNIVFRKYLKDTRYVKNALSQGEREKFNRAIAFFKKYAGDYDFDWLMIAAQAYQESGIDQSVRSPVGAVGVMQVLPTTAEGSPINIRNVETNVENNIHAGVKYLRFMINEYFADPAISPVDRHLFAFAGYNGGPNRIDRLRRKAAAQGLDPNKWFQNVEVVVARHIGRETTQYVGNIYKYYVAYKRSVEQHEERKKAKAQSG
jgi:membrane-bound lytic murein transglycosylase MltF